MELKSEPKQFEEIHYTDIDVAYPGDMVKSVTLEKGKDDCEFCADEQGLGDLIVRFGSGETLTLEARNRNWYSIRPRVQRRKVEDKA